MGRHQMQLTPEEKHRIYLEEKVRFKAKKRIRRETTKRRLGWFFGLGLLLVFITTVIIPERERQRFRFSEKHVDPEESQ
ncbi:MAG TPA: hypothetical protein EYO65_07470 [Nitrospirales bacterium]|nr:hypothetical protein [Nitrospirales bacterium]